MPKIQNTASTIVKTEAFRKWTWNEVTARRGEKKYISVGKFWWGNSLGAQEGGRGLL